MISYLAFQEATGAQDLIKNVFSHVSVHGRQGVVQNVDVRILVGGSCQADPLLLTPTEVYTLRQKTVLLSTTP